VRLRAKFLQQAVVSALDKKKKADEVVLNLEQQIAAMEAQLLVVDAAVPETDGRPSGVCLEGGQRDEEAALLASFVVVEPLHCSGAQGTPQGGLQQKERASRRPQAWPQMRTPSETNKSLCRELNSLLEDPRNGGRKSESQQTMLQIGQLVEVSGFAGAKDKTRWPAVITSIDKEGVIEVHGTDQHGDLVTDDHAWICPIKKNHHHRIFPKGNRGQPDAR